MAEDRSTRVDTTRLQNMARAYCQSAVLFAALDIELFTLVAGGADTVSKLADTADLSELNARRMVDVLLAAGLLERVGDSLANAPDAARYLVKGEHTYAGPWMTFTRPGVGNWFRLSEHLRNVEPPARLGLSLDLPVEEARRYHEATYSVGMGAGRRFCKQVDLSGRRHLLDLGGGSGAYCINAVSKFGGLSATVLDLPGVTVVAREFIEANGVADRVDTVSGDFTTTPFPACDVVLMASNLPMYNGEVIARVVEKAFAALEPGGEMHLVGEMLNEDGIGPLDAALWGLQEVLRNSEGRAHSTLECVAYLENAGFENVELNDFVPGVLKRVSGRKPIGAQ